MLKDATYKEKFALLNEWMPSLMGTIAKDLKNDHLKQDARFVKKYFSNKPINKLAAEELVAGYKQALAEEENSDEIAEFISNRWLLRNSEIYNHFEEELRRRYADFSELKEIDLQTSSEIIEGAVHEFGAPKTYLFSIINSVVFPQSSYDQLRSRAEKEARQQAVDDQAQEEQHTLATIHKNYEQQIARLTDKYEKKLQGLQKKYTQDVETLKKQISNLQRKLNG